MSLLKDIVSKVKYDKWANDRMLRVAEQNESRCRRSVEIMAHILICQQLWLNRIGGLDTAKFDVWQKFSAEQCHEIMKKNYLKLEECLSGFSEKKLRDALDYTDLEGEKKNIPFGVIFNQLLFHGAYHRGQISDELKRAKIDPPETDFMVFTQE